MKRQIILVIAAIILLVGCNSKKQQNPEFTVLKGATMFDGTGEIIEQCIIIIKEGIIQSISTQEVDIPDDAEVIDLSGKYITPGLVDAHVHFAQTGFFDGRPDVLDIRDSIDYVQLQSYLQNTPDRYYEAYLRSGVTAVYDVGGFVWSIKFQESAELNLNAPHVAAAGPLLTPVSNEKLTTFNTPAQKQMLNLSSPEFGRQAVRQHTSLGSTGIKIWQLHLEDPEFMKSLKAVADEVVIQGNKLIVHATSLDQAKEALRLGTKVLVHSVSDQPVDEEFIQLAKENGLIYLPTLIVGWGYQNAFRSLKGKFELNDPNNAVDNATKNLINSSTRFYRYYKEPDKFEETLTRMGKRTIRSEEISFDNLRMLYKAGVSIAVSTDAGNPGTLHGISIYDEMEAMQKAGIPAEDIIVMATKNGAMAMERFNDFGTLEKGKMADLIILDNDPSQDIANMRSISHVMRGGLLRPVNEPFKNNH